MRKNGTLNFILGDHLGSTSLVTDANGAVINETKYKAWGETRYSSGAEQTKYTYTGQYSYVSDFGLHFYNARWYDSSLGRFAQADSIMPGGIQGYDRYAYVNNNPIRYTDPTGHYIPCYGANYDDGPQCRQEGSPSKYYYDNWDYQYTEDYQNAKEELKEYGKLGLSIAFEPADWAMTLNDCANGNCSVLGLGFMVIPGISGNAGKLVEEYLDTLRRHPSTVAILKTLDGRIYKGHSGHGEVPNSVVKNLFGPNSPHQYDFGCAEIHCINQALKDNPDPTSLQGSIITAIRVRFPNHTLTLSIQPPCPDGCSIVLSNLGINFVP